MDASTNGQMSQPSANTQVRPGLAHGYLAIHEVKSHAKNFHGQSVEVDAIPPATLQALVRGVIERHIDERQLRVTKVAEESERQILGALANLDVVAVQS